MIKVMCDNCACLREAECSPMGEVPKEWGAVYLMFGGDRVSTIHACSAECMREIVRTGGLEGSIPKDVRVTSA